MNKVLLKTTLRAATGLLLVSQAAQAAYSPNDIVLGFNLGYGSGPNDYIIELGNANSGVGVGGTSVVNLSSQFSLSTFNGLYTNLSGGVSMSGVGGHGATSGRDLFATVPRLSLGTPDSPGSTAPGAIGSTFLANGANDVAGMVNGLSLSAGGNTTVSQSDPNSFFTWVLSTTPPSYLSGTGIDPRGSTSGSVLYEDLYRAANNVNGNAFAYLGYFTLDTTGSGSLTFTPQAVVVPEPSTFSLLAGGVLMGFLFRLRLKRCA